jgi:hypothetical protein
MGLYVCAYREARVEVGMCVYVGRWKAIRPTMPDIFFENGLEFGCIVLRSWSSSFHTQPS